METKGMTSRYNYGYALRRVVEEGKRVYGPRFEIAELDKPVIHKLLIYVLRDDVKAEKEGIDLRKGIMLTGPHGCGKTPLIQILKNLSDETFRPVIKSCRDISIEFGKKEYEMIRLYSTNAFHPYKSIPIVYCFDDLGRELNNDVLTAKCNVMAEILMSRYDFFMSHRMITHVITTLNGDELEALYGNVLRGRMRAMFNVIAFDPETADKR